MFLSSDQQKNRKLLLILNFFLRNCLYHGIALIIYNDNKNCCNLLFFFKCVLFRKMSSTVHFYTYIPLILHFTYTPIFRTYLFFIARSRADIVHVSIKRENKLLSHLILNVMVLVNGILLTIDNTFQSKHWT